MPHDTLVGLYLFLLGLASGLAVLTLTAYRRVSPRWLKWFLIAVGIFVISRYVTMALFTNTDAAQRFWVLRRCWFATSVGLTLPSVFAVDQLIRHPAMTPKKLLRWFAPFLVVYGAVILFGNATLVSDHLVGWTPRLASPWQWLLSGTQAIFVVGFVSVCLVVIRKVPSGRIRLALWGLVLAHGYLGFDGLLLAFGSWYPRPFLYSEMLTLLVLWHAYDTGAELQGRM